MMNPNKVLYVTRPLRAANPTLTFPVTFDLRGQFEVLGRGTDFWPEFPTGWSKNGPMSLDPPGQLTQPWPSPWPLTLEVKFEVRGRGTDFRPEFPTGGLQKWSYMSLDPSGQLTQPWPSPWPLTLEVKFEVIGRGTDFEPNFQKDISKNGPTRICH